MEKPHENLKVLIVEDDRPIAEMYAITLMRQGYTVFIAGNGSLALEKIRTKNPDVILLDIMMPGMDGIQVLRQIRRNVKRYVPVIMLTNLDTGHFLKKADFGDVDAYMIKSHHTPAEIADKVAEVLRLNRKLVI